MYMNVSHAGQLNYVSDFNMSFYRQTCGNASFCTQEKAKFYQITY